MENILPRVSKKKGNVANAPRASANAAGEALFFECGSLANKAAGRAISRINRPNVRSAACQPKCRTSVCEIYGTAAPPNPIPKYANPIAFPRDLLNQRDNSTWFGSGPPHTYPNAFRI